MKIIVRLAALLGLGLMYSCGGGEYCPAQTTPVVVASTVSCATSVDGSVVGLPNPLNPPVVAPAFTGTLAAGNYYVQMAWYDAAAHVTLVGPEVQVQLSGTGSLVVNIPASGMPALATGMKVYIGSSSGAETLQGSTTGAAAFTQSSALASGAAVPPSNNTVCALVANDAGWPTGTGYQVSMTTPAGDTVPGYPMQWQLLGPGGTINLGQGLPYYTGTVSYPVPLLARPYNHASQSISGPLSMTGYALTQVSKLGVGTSVPGWPVDVENGAVNASGGFIVNGGQGVATGNCLAADSDTFHTFRVSVGCVTSLPTVYYQTVEAAGAGLAQQRSLNILSSLSAVNNGGNSSTDVGLPSVGTAGVYTSPSSITFDAFGREVAVTASSAVSRACPSACYIILADGTTIEWGTAPGIAGGGTEAVTFPHAFTTSANLTVTTSAGGGAGNILTKASSITASGFTAGIAGVIFVGGSGSSPTGSETIQWTAVGH